MRIRISSSVSRCQSRSVTRKAEALALGIAKALPNHWPTPGGTELEGQFRGQHHAHRRQVPDGPAALPGGAGLHPPSPGDLAGWAAVLAARPDLAPALGFDDCLAWAKDRLVLSRGDYHWQHEPCWYAVRAKGKGHWAGDRKQTTLWQIANRDQDADTVHGTQKPVECMRRPILNNSSPGQAVYEPFMEFGTTLIAAETTGRVCFGIELNPAYVYVAIERWQSFTGQEAVLAETGETFAALKAKRLAA
nr:DNA methyltransferase [Cereibacter johrii]